MNFLLVNSRHAMRLILTLRSCILSCVWRRIGESKPCMSYVCILESSINRLQCLLFVHLWGLEIDLSHRKLHNWVGHGIGYQQPLLKEEFFKLQKRGYISTITEGIHKYNTNVNAEKIFFPGWGRKPLWSTIVVNYGGRPGRSTNIIMLDCHDCLAVIRVWR